MTITFLDLYNKITGQAWSMFDGEIEDKDEFETSVTSSIQKALTTLWCSFDFPFRHKDKTFYTQENKATYRTPNGNIARKIINGCYKHIVQCDNDFLSYNPDCEVKEEKTGKPKYFYIKNDKIVLYPIPDDKYKIKIEYVSFYTSCDADDEPKSILEEDTDYIYIPEKFENLFLNALLPLAMTYLIASETDENFSQYQEQYEKAYKILLEYTMGICIEKHIGW